MERSGGGAGGRRSKGRHVGCTGTALVCTRVQNVYIDNDVSRFDACPDGIPVPPSNNRSPSGGQYSTY